jgi:hypothetical protein
MLSTLLRLLCPATFAVLLCACESHQQPLPHVYVVSDRALMKYLQPYGFHGEDFHVIWTRPQDSKFAVRELTAGADGDVYVVSAGGSPRRLKTAHRAVYLNSSGEIGAWYDSFNDGVHFRDGSIRRILGSRFEVSADGSMFCQRDRDGGRAAVFDLDQPAKPIFTFDADSAHFNPDDICVQNDHIYIIDYGHRHLTDRNCWVFTRRGETYEKEAEMNIPGYVTSTMPWSNSLVLSQWHDFPVPARAFVFNIASRDRADLGYLPKKGVYVLWDDWAAFGRLKAPEKPT